MEASSKTINSNSLSVFVRTERKVSSSTLTRLNVISTGLTSGIPSPFLPSAVAAEVTSSSAGRGEDGPRRPLLRHRPSRQGLPAQRQAASAPPGRGERKEYRPRDNRTSLPKYTVQEADAKCEGTPVRPPSKPKAAAGNNGSWGPDTKSSKSSCPPTNGQQTSAAIATPSENGAQATSSARSRGVRGPLPVHTAAALNSPPASSPSRPRQHSQAEPASLALSRYPSAAAY